MNKRKFLMLLPTILCPYMLIGFFALVWFSVGNPILEAVLMENRVFFIMAFLVFFILGALISAAVFFVLALSGKWNSLSLAKTAMIIKLIHIPSYIIIFLLGVLFFLSIWLILFAILLAIFDYMTLMMSGAVTMASVINASREGKCSFKSNLWVFILQFIFCADVVASIIFYFKLKKSSRILKKEGC